MPSKTACCVAEGHRLDWTIVSYQQLYCYAFAVVGRWIAFQLAWCRVS